MPHTIPDSQETLALPGKPLYEIWGKLCARIDARQSGLETLRSHLEAAQSGALLYEMT